MRREWPVAVCIVALTLAAYANAFNGTFHYDDFHSVVDNRATREVANIPRFFTDPGLFSADSNRGMYRPLLLVTYTLNYAVTGDRARGFLVLNWLLHCGCALLVWRLARHLHHDDEQPAQASGSPPPAQAGGSPLPAQASGSPPPAQAGGSPLPASAAALPSSGWAWPPRWCSGQTSALVAALFFALHPVATEPVNYISSRSESLAALFYLLVLWLHVRDRRNRVWPRWGLVAYAGGLLVKSVVITAPVCLMAHDLLMQGRLRPIRRYLPYAALATGYLALIVANGFLTASLAAPARDWEAQVWTQVKAPVHYLLTLIVPVRLSVEPQFATSHELLKGPVIAAVLVIAAGSGVMWRTRQSRPLPAFAVAFGIITMTPATVMPLNMLVNDRRLYLPLAGMAWLLSSLAWRRRAIFPVLFVLGLLTAQRNAVWRNEVSLWQDAVRKGPLMYRAQTNLGRALQLNGEATGALAAYRRALDLRPGHADALNNLGTVLQQKALTAAHPAQQDSLLMTALDHYDRALRIDPSRPLVLQNKADALVRAGRVDRAVEVYRQALRLAPEHGAIWANYGQALYAADRLDQARAAFLRAIELWPEQPEPYNNLGNVYHRRGQSERAAIWYEQALTRQPADRARVLLNLAGTNRDMKRLETARQQVNQVLELEPDLPAALFELARIERAAGDWEAAIRPLRTLVQQDSTHLPAQAEWGEILAAAGAHAQAIEQFEAALEHDARYGRALFGLGGSAYALGRREQARAAYQSFLQVWDRDDQRRNVAQRRLTTLRSDP